MAKHVVVYHDKCNDGFGAAFIAWKALVEEGHEVTLIPANYGDKPIYPYDEPGHLHILDFSFHVPALLELCSVYETVTWLDHHKTAIDAFAAEGYMSQQEIPPANLQYWLTDKHSGAKLAWNHYFPEVDVPRWVQLIDDRDRWIFQYPETKAFHAGLSLIPRNVKHWWAVTSSQNAVDLVVKNGGAILSYQQILYEQLMETAHEITIDGKKGLAINAPGQFASDLGNLLAAKSGTFGAVYATDGKGYKFSLRSIGDYDVSAIAKAFGGGGHKNAAGFTITNGFGITGVTLWSRTDELTSYAANAGGTDNEE